MEHNVQLLTDYIKSTIQICEDADRPMLAKEVAEVNCPMKNGYSSSFEFTYLNNHYGSEDVKGQFQYYDTGLGILEKFKYEVPIPFSSLNFLTQEIYDNEVVPALRSWLEEKVCNEPFGGLYAADFGLQLLIGENHELEYRDYISVNDPKRKATQREMVRSFLLNKTYETMDVKSDEYNPVVSDILRIIPTLFGELPAEVLKEAVAIICRKYKEADSWYFSNAVLHPLTVACNIRLRVRGVNEYGLKDWVLTDENISDEELDFVCWIGLQIIRYADDGNARRNGENILNWISAKGFRKAKDYLKFGSGEIAKEYTHLKTPKFEAVGNDIRRTVEFKVKTEDAESYGGMINFILNLIKRNFPPDYQIKINAKLKNPIPVDGLNERSKSNLFWGNAATFPELWPLMTEYVRTIADEYTYYSDATDEEAVTVGGYAVYAMGAADLSANIEIATEFMEHVDFEHDLTARSFVLEFMDDDIANKYGLLD